MFVDMVRMRMTSPISDRMESKANRWLMNQEAAQKWTEVDDRNVP